MTILATAVSMMLSALYVSFRDMLIIWSVAATVLFYATPILYPINAPTTEGFRAALMANPIAVILEQARVWIIDPTAPSAAESAGGVARLIPATVIFFSVCFFGWRVFTREAPRIAEKL
jgi:ABC-2 type transport system permease protein